MSCTYDRDQLAFYMNGDATPAERQATREHLRSCADCREIMLQYQTTAARLAESLSGVRPSQGPSRRTAAPRWRCVVVAAAVIPALLISAQVPAVAAVIGKVFPWISVVELNHRAVAVLIRGFSQDQAGKVYAPDLFQTVAEAEQAWGGRIPQPSAVPAGMELYRIEMFRWQSGQKDVYFRYRNPTTGGNLTLHLSTTAQRRMVPRGATREVTVNGQKSVVISGTFGRFPGQLLQWEPESDIHLFLPVGDLYGEVSTAGQQSGITVSDLVKVAESIR